MSKPAERIAKLRLTLGINQGQLGAMAGVTKSAVSQWERGDTEPSAEALARLHENCGVSLDWLRTGREPIFAVQEDRGMLTAGLEGLSHRSRYLLAELILATREGRLGEEDLQALVSMANHLQRRGPVVR